MSEKLIAKIDVPLSTVTAFAFSPDRQKIAYAVTENEKTRVFVDGKEGKQYDHI